MIILLPLQFFDIVSHRHSWEMLLKKDQNNEFFLSLENKGITHYCIHHICLGYMQSWYFHWT